MTSTQHLHLTRWLLTCSVSVFAASCGGGEAPPESTEPEPVPAAEAEPVPDMIEMGGEKSVTTFFVTSVGLGNGGDLGGLAGADAHCQALA
ncbi:MAG: hypothetical protein VYE68_08370, partial [Acidobacteriota bacterium]|nr:hypothetical protein [Acidobacteriota bacterium]